MATTIPLCGQFGKQTAPEVDKLSASNNEILLFIYTPMNSSNNPDQPSPITAAEDVDELQQAINLSLQAEAIATATIEKQLGQQSSNNETSTTASLQSLQPGK